MSKTVLVTGAAGFLGSHISLKHLMNGDTVIGVDDFSSSKRDSKHLSELKAFKKNFSLVKCNISSATDYVLLLEHITDKKNLEKIDVIYNFACPASPPVYQRMPVHTMLTCVVGTQYMLELAKRLDSTLVHASTSEVYGDPDHSPQSEDYKGNVNSYGPRACYDEGKRAAEALCYDYLNKHSVDARLVRIFNTYGPNMDPNDGRVVSNFICQRLRRQPLTVYGGGTQTRSFCYVDDLVRGIISLGELDKNPYTPINLGNPTEFTVLDLAFKVASLVHRIPEDSSSISHMINDMPLPVDDPKQRRPDITLAKKWLNWEPRVQLNEGLAKTIEYFKTVVK